MMNWVYIVVLSIASFWVRLPESVSDHQFHLSKCQIAYNKTDQAIQVSMHIFIDDLEDALKKRGQENLFINTAKEVQHADSVIYQYLQDVFQLQADDAIVSYTYVGKESSEDLQAIWCYLEVENIETLKKLEITNKLLMDVFDDQKNIVMVEREKERSAYFMFTTSQYSDTVEF